MKFVGIELFFFELNDHIKSTTDPPHYVLVWTALSYEEKE